MALAVLETSLPSDKRWPGPLIRIFEVDTFFFLIRLRLIIASWALSASLKDDLATSAAFLFGRSGVSLRHIRTITFSLDRKDKSPTTCFPVISSSFGGNPTINSG